MTRSDVETYHQDGSWHNKIEGTDAVLGSFPTKREATASGRERAIADRATHTVRNEDGRIGERYSYGPDPRNIRG